LQLRATGLVAGYTPKPDAKTRKYWVSELGVTGDELRRVAVGIAPRAFLDSGDAYLGLLRESRRGRSRRTMVKVGLSGGPVKTWEVASEGEDDQGGPGEGLFDVAFAIDGRRIFAGRGATMVCIDSETGSELWCTPMGDVGTPSLGVRGPIVAEGRVIVQGSDGIVTFDAETGKVAWAQPYWGARAVCRGRLYVIQAMSSTKSYMVFDVQSGKMLMSSDLVGALKNKFKATSSGQWRGGLALTRPAVSETHVFVGDDVGRLWASERETGEPVWFDLPDNHSGYLGGQPIIDGNRLYVTSMTLDQKKNPSALYCYEQAHDLGGLLALE